MRAMFIKVTRQAIKPDDIVSTLVEVIVVPGSWTTRKLLSDNTFFVVCLSFEVVHNLLTLNQIHGEGFFLLSITGIK